jgi:hypothetical protein
MIMRFCTIFFALSTIAWAGDCAETPQRDAFCSAVLVFEGRVLKVEPVGGYSFPRSDKSDKIEIKQSLAGSPALVTFSVTRSWKGQSHPIVKTLVLQTSASGGGYVFQAGHDYMVYTNEATKWEAVVRMARPNPVYDLGGQCPLRIRSDVAAERG